MLLLSYKGYHGSIEYSPEDNILFGRVLGLENTFISYEGTNATELNNDFEASVNHYLDSCKYDETQPETEKTELIQVEWNKMLQSSLT